MKIKAAVTRRPGEPFVIEEISLEEPQSDEVRVRIVATGLCHTDIVVRDQIIPTPLPIVLGHEGSGYVEAVGSDVTHLAVGDPVVLGFAACHECTQCVGGEPAYCAHFMPLNFGGARADGTRALHDGEDTVGSHFFGQSSFASHALVAARNVVKVTADAPLELLGPLGCGIMTGAGAVLRSLAVTEGQTVLIAGGGPVGLSAVLAARVASAGRIVLVDPLESRRALASELGATDTIDPADGKVQDLLRSLLPGGVDRALDTSGSISAIEAALHSLAPRGRLAMVGVPPALDSAISVPVLHLLSLGASICGVTEGDADPQTFIPYLVELHRQGRFPFDRMIASYPLEEINRAIEDQREGRCVKAVLTL